MDPEIVNKIKEEESIAMLAPAFAIDFEYPNIIGMLRKLGFDKVVELTYGARMVNWWYVEYIKEHPDQKYYIASPCPTVVTFIKSKYPHLTQYMMPYASPMLSMARILKKHYPDFKIYFISPCLAKRNLEISQHGQEINGAITFKELDDIFTSNGIITDDYNRQYQFDSLIHEYTKIYPISGGLARTSHLSKIFKEDEIFIDDGIVNIDPVLKQMSEGDSPYRFLDILNCNGGCIGGPAIVNQQLSVEDRKAKIKEYLNEASERDLGPHRGHLEYAEGIDLSVKF